MNDKEIYENWKITPEIYRNDMVKFQSWFDTTDSIKSTVAQGHIDFHSKILTSAVYRTIGDVKQKNCLEIGFGGGRLLNAASKVFSNATGIDIHTCFDVTDRFLKQNGADNYKLIHANDADSVPDESIDFVFSFIVFQHFGSIGTFYEYLDLIKRVLVRGGCCNLHLAKNTHDPNGYFIKSDIQPNTGYSSLFYGDNFVRNVLIERGFEIVEEGQMTKSPWTSNLSNQFYITFKK